VDTLPQRVSLLGTYFVDELLLHRRPKRRICQGEDGLAQDIEEIAGALDFPGLPPDAKPMPHIYH
jgi:hypothetical protein